MHCYLLAPRLWLSRLAGISPYHPCCQTAKINYACWENLSVLCFPSEHKLLFQDPHPDYQSLACKKITADSAEMSHTRTYFGFVLLCKQHLSPPDLLLVLQVGPGPPFLFAVLQAQLLPELFCKFTVTRFAKSLLQISPCEVATW